MFYGASNLFPDEMIELYDSSAMHRTCIDAIKDGIIGDGIELIGEEYVTSEDDRPIGEFEETFYDEFDVGGTKTASGEITIGDETNLEDDNLASDIVNFIKENHPDIRITEQSLDLFRVDEGVVTFAVALDEYDAPKWTKEFQPKTEAPVQTIPEVADHNVPDLATSASNDFPITVISQADMAQSKKK
jgi:hypothetical protein